MIESLHVWDSGNSVKNAIGGRLFTTGLDINGDGNTDFVFFGESDTPSGKLSALKGGVVRLYIDDDNPANWDFTIPFLNLAKQPITAKIEAAKCFDKWYLFLGSGRYFTTADNYPIQQDFIMAVPFTCTVPNDPSTCPGSINDVHGGKTEVCAEVSGSSSTTGKETWLIDLAAADANYYKERLITDPTVSSQNMVFFTTTQPYGPGRICDSGGRTRIWGLNCATGEALTDTSCPAAQITDTSGTIYLQTSTGTINKIVVTDAFTAEGGKASPWLEGIPPETSTPFVGRYQGRVGKIMHWIEK
jgi:type IV pilus assembly protein PilY1